MKYYFCNDINGSRSLIVAKNKENAVKIFYNDESNATLEDIYELQKDTFDEEGYLFWDEN